MHTHNCGVHVSDVCCFVGSWLYLHNLHLLPLPLIHATVDMLRAIYTAAAATMPTVDIAGEGLRLASPSTTLCVASTTPTALPSLPGAMHSVFQTASLPSPQTIVVVEALLLANGFTTAHTMSHPLLSLWHGTQAVLTPRLLEAIIV